MNRLIDFVRGLIADANLAIAPMPAGNEARAVPGARSLDHPTYLRRGLVIAGLPAGSPPPCREPRASLPGCRASR